MSLARHRRWPEQVGIDETVTAKEIQGAAEIVIHAGVELIASRPGHGRSDEVIGSTRQVGIGHQRHNLGSDRVKAIRRDSVVAEGCTTWAKWIKYRAAEDPFLFVG